MKVILKKTKLVFTLEHNIYGNGYFIRSSDVNNGKLVKTTEVGICYSHDYIPVSVGDTIKFESGLINQSNPSYSLIVLYDNNKQILGSYSSSGINNVIEKTISNGDTAYFRVCFKSDIKAKVFVNGDIAWKADTLVE